MDTLSLQTSATLQTCPAHGAKTVCGLRSVQEDAFSVQTNFFVFATPSCSPVDDVLNKLPARIATQSMMGMEALKQPSTALTACITICQ
ncbi:PPM-type phosphatase domain-containing protein [Haematococcus lacustris]|uniref:PPM-type phosphatase domain-containing protein n=1 Tax=Haematococcus lacustris TaxID=44745 RepID=A0A699ZCP5_HAELA|nr:PPM-type phosphatase domain-containing protein [Haematococcus lacustris]